MAATEQASIKTSYREDAIFEQLFGGGPLRVTPTGNHLIAACGEDINVIAVATGELERVLTGDGEQITSICVHPTLQHCIVSSRSYQAFDSPVMDASFDPSGSLIALASAESKVVMVCEFHPDPDRQLLISGGADGAICVFDMMTREQLVRFKKHTAPVTAITFSPDGSRMMSTGRDNIMCLWNLDDFGLLTTIKIEETVESMVTLNPPSTMAIPTAKAAKHSLDTPEYTQHVFVATCGEESKIKLWDLSLGRCVSMEEHAPLSKMMPFEQMSLCPGTGELVSSRYDQTIAFHQILWPQEDEQEYIIKESKLICGNHEEVYAAKFISEHNVLLATNTESLRLIDTSSQHCSLMHGHQEIVLSLDVSSDGKRAISCGKDCTVKYWDLENRRLLASGIGHTSDVTCVALAPKFGKYAVSSGKDMMLKMWNLDNVEKKLVSKGTPKLPLPLSCTFTVKAHDKETNSVAISPNDRLVATGGMDKMCHIWNAADLTKLNTCKGHRRGVWSVTFSSIDRVVATTSADRTAKIWSLQDFSCLKTFEGHTSSVLNAAFISSGLQLLTVGSDALMKIWNIKNSECAGTFDNHEDKIWALAVDEDGKKVLTAGADSSITIWRDATEEVKEEVKVEAETKMLKEQELANALFEKAYEKALTLALKLGHPRHCLTVIRAIEEKEGRSIDENPLDHLVKDMAVGDLTKLLLFARDWNTNAKSCLAAHHLINAILRTWAPEKLAKIDGIRQIIAGILAYTERHVTRLSSLQKASGQARELVDIAQGAKTLDRDSLRFIQAVDSDRIVRRNKVESEIQELQKQEIDPEKKIKQFEPATMARAMTAEELKAENDAYIDRLHANLPDDIDVPLRMPLSEVRGCQRLDDFAPDAVIEPQLRRKLEREWVDHVNREAGIKVPFRKDKKETQKKKPTLHKKFHKK